MNKIAAMVLNHHTQMDEPTDMLIMKSAPQSMTDAGSRANPRMLFSEFWHEGEICILFADTNIGKSILAVQIADRISKGMSDSIFTIDAPAQRVMYLDFELSEKQFEMRYSDEHGQHYPFDENLYRVEINTDFEGIMDFETELEMAIEKAISDTGIRVLIVDNITYLKTQSTETAKDALPLMKMLRRLKQKYELSILALAHTPKRDHFKELSVNDLAGSKHLSNFADSIFAIGQSHQDRSLRYLKQIKARATAKFYDSDYVIVCRIEKEGNFLGFSHVGFDREWLHLKQKERPEKDELEEQVVALYREDSSLSMREIAKRLGGIHDKRVKRILVRHGLVPE